MTLRNLTMMDFISTHSPATTEHSDECLCAVLLKRNSNEQFEFTLALSKVELSGTADLRLDPTDPMIQMDQDPSQEITKIASQVFLRLWKLAGNEAIARTVPNPTYYGLDKQFQFWTVPSSYLEIINKELNHEKSPGDPALQS